MLSRSTSLRWSLHVFLLLLGAGNGVAQRPSDAVRRDPARWVWSVPELVPGLEHGEIHSTAMDRPVGYNIYLPPSYQGSPDRRYPVVFFLHGATGNEKSDSGFSRVVDEAIRASDIGETIYVFPNGGPFSNYADWPDSYVRAETLIVRELIPHIDQRYRTLGTQGGRAALGYSMGGHGAVRLAMKHPDLFCAVASLAGAFGEGRAGQTGDSVFEWSRAHADRIKERLALYFVCGDRDRLLRQHHRFLAHLDELEVSYAYTVHTGVEHSLGQLTRLSGPDVVRWLAGHYEAATP